MTDTYIDPFLLYWGKPIQIDQELKVYPLTLDEIADLGYQEYNNLLGVFIIDKERLVNSNILNNVEQDISSYDLVVGLSNIDDNFKESAEKALSLFLHEDVIFIQTFFIINREKHLIISNSLFDDIRKVIYIQYQIDNMPQKKAKYTDKQKELLAMMDKIKADKFKGRQDQSINLLDIISMVASYSNGYTYENIGKLTVYTLYDIYQRLFNWDDYHIGIQLLPYSSEKNPKLKHWNTKLNKIN
jgi:hypothetical protein